MLDTELNGKVVHGETQMSNMSNILEDYIPKEDSQHMEWGIGGDDTGYEAALSMYKTLDKRFISLSARKKLERYRKREKTLTRKMQKLFEQSGIEDDEMQIDVEDHPNIMNLAIRIAVTRIQYRHDVFFLGLQATLKNIEEFDESKYPQLIEQGIVRTRLFGDTLRAWGRLPIFDINNKAVREIYHKANALHFHAIDTLATTAKCINSHPSTKEWVEEFIQLLDVRKRQSA